MLRGALRLFIVLLASVACFAATAGAAGYSPSVSTLEHCSVIYYHNGSSACGPVNGTITVNNPSTRSPLSSVNAILPDGSVALIGRVGPSSGGSADYSLESGVVPLKLNETITPASLTGGVPGQLRLCVEVENAGSANVTAFTYRKALPPGLDVAWKSNTGGVLVVNDTVTWTLDVLRPGEKDNVAVALDLTPSSDLDFPGASAAFTYGASLAGAGGFTGDTDASFLIKKSNPAAGIWRVEASVPDDGEFTIDLLNVTIYRASAADPFNASTIAFYAPGASLDPGCSWNATLDDHYEGVPAYFIKASYKIPYTLDQSSAIEARTEPTTISARGLSPTSVPYVPSAPLVATAMPTVIPSPSATPPFAGPDIVFLAPADGEVVTDNATWLEISALPSSSAEYVVYYGSADNATWAVLGQSPVVGNLSGLIWNVPPANGKYFLKAEHFGPQGLRGVAYAQVLIAHEIAPVGLSTMLMQGQDWLMLFIVAMAALLALLLVAQYLLRGPVVYDTSALLALSKGVGGRASKLPDRAIRPDSLPPGMEGIGRAKVIAIKAPDEVSRLEREYALAAYDAMALRLAKETGATLYSDDARLLGICRRLGVKAMPVKRPADKIKRKRRWLIR